MERFARLCRIAVKRLRRPRRDAGAVPIIAVGGVERYVASASHVIPAHRSKISALEFTPDGRTIVSGDKSGTLAFSHVETGRFLYDLKLADQTIYELAFSPDGAALAVAAAEKVLMLQVNGESAGDAGGLTSGPEIGPDLPDR